MSGYRCVNYFELCRLCTASHGTKTHIFSEEGRRKDLIGKIAVCLPVVIDEHDKLPKILCAQCLNQVESIAKFRETCINAQTMLESCLNSSKLGKGGKVYIKDVVPKKATATTTIAGTHSTPALTKTTLTTPAIIASTQSQLSTAPPLVKTTYQPKPTANVTTTPTDFLSSIIQAVGIQNIDDTPETIVAAPVVQQTTQTPQYTITLDSKTIKSNQIHYKIEAAKPLAMPQEHPQPTFSSTYQNSALAQVDEFLKLKTNPQISATIVKRESTVKIDTTPAPKKQKFNLVITSPPTNNQQPQQQQQHQQHQIKQQATIKANAITPTTTVQKHVSLQDLKLISPNKCYLPITLKDGTNGKQIVAQIDTKNLVLPTAYLQMKLPPQLTTVDNQHVVQLANIPNTLSLTTTAQPQIRQQQQLHQQQIQATTKLLPTTSETKTLFTTSTGQNVTITHQPLVTLASSAAIQSYNTQQSTVTVAQPQAQLIPAASIPQTSTIDTPAGKVQLTMLQNVPTSNITHALPQKSGITIQRIKTDPTTKTINTIHQSAPTILAQQNCIVASTAATTIAAAPATIVVTTTGTNASTRTLTTSKINNKTISTSSTNSAAGVTVATITTAAVPAVATTTTTTVTTNQTKSEVPTCDVCEKVFKRKEHLAQHVKLHLGLRPFKCEEPNCNKAFSRKEHLMRHVVSHTGKKMFSCEFCQKLFSRKDNLNKHRRTHVGPSATGPYVCDICQKSFVVKLYYEQHQAIHEANDDKSNHKIFEIVENESTISMKTVDANTTSKIFVTNQCDSSVNNNYNNTKSMLLNSTSESLSHIQAYDEHPPNDIQFIPTVIESPSLIDGEPPIIIKTENRHDMAVLNLPINYGNVVALSTDQYHELVMNQQYKDRM